MTAGWSRPVGVAILAGVVAATAGALLDGPWLWICAGLAALATGLGARADLADVEPRGVPRASLVLPAVACVSTAGLARLAGATEAVLPIAVGGGILVLLSVLAERRALSPLRRHAAASAGVVLPLAVVLAATAFVAVAAAVAGSDATGAISALPESSAALIAAADASLAFLLGYRLSAVSARGRIGAAVAAGTFALSVAAAVGFARASSLPAAVAPLLPAAAFLLWTAYRSAAAEERGRWHWVWEYAGLAAACAVAVGWNLLLR